MKSLWFNKYLWLKTVIDSHFENINWPFENINLKVKTTQTDTTANKKK